MRGAIPRAAAKWTLGGPSMRSGTCRPAICAELKINPRVAREKLRVAIREPKKYPNLAGK